MLPERAGPGGSGARRESPHRPASLLSLLTEAAGEPQAAPPPPFPPWDGVGVVDDPLAAPPAVTASFTFAVAAAPAEGRQLREELEEEAVSRQQGPEQLELVTPSREDLAVAAGARRWAAGGPEGGGAGGVEAQAPGPVGSGPGATVDAAPRLQPEAAAAAASPGTSNASSASPRQLPQLSSMSLSASRRRLGALPVLPVEI